MESGLSSLSPAALATLAFLAGAVLLAAVKLGWGMAQWRRKGEHRVGERWGAEAAEVVEWSGAEGYVRAGGELWRARSKQALAPGERVTVERVDGLVLEVSRRDTA